MGAKPAEGYAALAAQEVEESSLKQDHISTYRGLRTHESLVEYAFPACMASWVQGLVLGNKSLSTCLGGLGIEPKTLLYV